MSLNEPRVSVYCRLKNGDEYESVFNIDLSYDPLIQKSYTEAWILYLIEKKYGNLDNLEQIHICQVNADNCACDLPKWYIDRNNN